MVARRWVITAAHCITDVAPFNPGNYQVIIGLTQLPTTPEPDHTYTVARYQMDSRYDGQTRMHDLAVVELTRDVPVAPVSVPRPTDAAAWAAGQPSTAAGWGTTSENGSPSPDLRRVTMPVVSDSSCAASYGLVAAQTALMLCAGLPEGGVDTCQGDSGGPLLVTGPAGPLLAGATSFGQGCAEAGFPGVYTEVAAERDFLDATIAPDAPTLLSAAPAGAGAVAVTFTPGPTDQGIDATGYAVTASPGGATTTVPAGATSATVTGLAAGTTYTFTVQALSGIGSQRAVQPGDGRDHEPGRHLPRRRPGAPGRHPGDGAGRRRRLAHRPRRRPGRAASRRRGGGDREPDRHRGDRRRLPHRLPVRDVAPAGVQRQLRAGPDGGQRRHRGPRRRRRRLHLQPGAGQRGGRRHRVVRVSDRRPRCPVRARRAGPPPRHPHGGGQGRRGGDRGRARARSRRARPSPVSPP